MYAALLAGFTLCLSLIVAIGAQNAFILKQGLYRQHVLWVVLVCSFSDIILICFGVFGLSLVTDIIPSVERVARYIGFIFLLCYGAMSFWRAFKQKSALYIQDNQAQSLKKTISICLALTWLNPHVYLDTVLLLGSIATQYPNQHGYFALGACAASIVFFFCLGYGAAFLRPLFAKPKAWQILEVLIGVVMWVIAIKLIV